MRTLEARKFRSTRPRGKNWKHTVWSYGISTEQYGRMLEEQNGLCAICGRDPDEFGQFVIDHDHATHKVRGLLCPRCNMILGRVAEDTIPILRKALAYLEKSRGPRKCSVLRSDG